MNIKFIYRIPENVFYLSGYPELLNLLPQHESYILNKVMTGCGATTMFLEDPVPTILCSPRKEMLWCKAMSPQFKNRVHRFGSAGGDVLQKIYEMKGYVQTHIPNSFGLANPPKILVTYDSAKHVFQGLQEMGLLQYFRVVVDEFHTLFTDAAFRGDTEAEFMTNITRVQLPVVYLSATPFIEKYLDQLDEFKNLPYIELEWPESSRHSLNIVYSKYIQGSMAKTMKAIIDNFRQRGYFAELMDENGNIHQSNEAVIFVNDVSFIVSTIKSNKLTPQDVNIICADNPKNADKLRKIGHSIGHAPQYGDPHKTFTFVTKCGFEGTDFYSTCAYTYIFSDIDESLKHLAIDISLDIPQIMGRQRRPDNLFRYSASFYTKTKLDFSEKAQQAFLGRIKGKSDDTDDEISDFNRIRDPKKRKRRIRQLRNNLKVDKYENDYVYVVDDMASGTPQVVFNKYVMLNEVRAWEVQRDQFVNGASVLGAANQAFSATTTQVSQRVNVFLQGFGGSFEQRMRMYCEFADCNPECKGELQKAVQVPTRIKEYYNFFGSAVLSSLGWKEASILQYFQQTVPQGDLSSVIRSTFIVGSWYSLTDIKRGLQAIYDTYTPGRKAKATDLKVYLNCQEQKPGSPDGKRVYGYRILG